MTASNETDRGVAASAPLVEAMLALDPWLRRRARALTSSADAADELVQSAWVAALTRRPDPARSLEPWLERVLRNVKSRRARAATSHIVTLEVDLEQRADTSALAAAAPSTPASALEARECALHLAAALARLPEPYRSVLRARFEEGHSVGEIADSRREPRATVSSWLRRGLERLRGVLGSRGSSLLGVLGFRRGRLDACAAVQRRERSAAPLAAAPVVGALVLGAAALVTLVVRPLDLGNLPGSTRSQSVASIEQGRPPRATAVDARSDRAAGALVAPAAPRAAAPVGVADVVSEASPLTDAAAPVAPPRPAEPAALALHGVGPDPRGIERASEADVAARDAAELLSDDDDSLRDVAAAPSSDLVVRVLGRGPSTPWPYFIGVTPLGGGAASFVEPSPDGVVTLSGLQPGTYALRISALHHAAFAQQLELIAGERRELDATLAPLALAPGIAGRVTCESGRYAPRVVVVAASEGGAQFRVPEWRGSPSGQVAEFVFDEVADGAQRVFVVGLDGHDAWLPTELEARPGARDLEFRLLDARPREDLAFASEALAPLVNDARNDGAEDPALRLVARVGDAAPVTLAYQPPGHPRGYGWDVLVAGIGWGLRPGAVALPRVPLGAEVAWRLERGGAVLASGTRASFGAVDEGGVRAWRGPAAQTVSRPGHDAQPGAARAERTSSAAAATTTTGSSGSR